ncbi:anion permease [Terasakiella sp. A23]|uniref:inorganic phosphate transporter n=1 Tax=Terasakiella sp. FCG-A23 TaxID=3080561 RepID=UPI002955473F|nr:inorganic phosphate transporter [Terasakiella sp. A23]MDV7339391.1 anion permease [Terasakiella sp. A23]
MSDGPLPSGEMKKLDKELKQIGKFEAGIQEVSRGNLKFGICVLFLVLVGFFAYTQVAEPGSQIFIILAGLLGAYMALNIGANDVANNIGPAVGSKALTMTGALIIAAIFEAAGAIIAGGDVVSTVRKGIIDPSAMENDLMFIHAMMAALFAAALWVNLATFVGAPVSTTHSVVGGVMGAGIAATGLSAVNWATMSKIAASWVISPVLGGVIAALFLALIKFQIMYKEDKVSAAKKWVPVLVGVMAAAFAMYLTMKGLKKIWKPGGEVILLIGATFFFGTWFAVKPMVTKAAENIENRRRAVSDLFTIPLIFSAALLSFAHGANDVANAVGPLAAVVGVASGADMGGKVDLPLWILVVGALGIAAGLMLFGPKLVRTVGEQITKLDRARAYCVALSAAITVIIASKLGLPVSSTHIAVGGIFGVGFFREYLESKRKANAIAEGNEEPLSAKKEAKARKRKLVRRQHLMTIAAAWVITVPLSAFIAGIIYWVMRFTL